MALRRRPCSDDLIPISSAVNRLAAISCWKLLLIRYRTISVDAVIGSVEARAGQQVRDYVSGDSV